MATPGTFGVSPTFRAAPWWRNAVTTTTLATAGTLGLTAAGGSFFGPLGVGAGALVGSFLFGGSSQKVEGPRLGDLSVAASSYGGVIPVGIRRPRKVAGTIIWATDIREEKHSEYARRQPVRRRHESGRVPLFREFRGSTRRGSGRCCDPHLGRRQADRPAA